MSNEAAYAMLDALGDRTRREIVERLRDGPLPVGRLADRLPVGRPAVSKHLRVLEGAGVVEHHRVGTRNLYALAPDGLVALQRWLVDTWDRTLSAYASAVADRVERQHNQREEPPSDPVATGAPPGRRTRRR